METDSELSQIDSAIRFSKTWRPQAASDEDLFVALRDTGMHCSDGRRGHPRYFPQMASQDEIP